MSAAPVYSLSAVDGPPDPELVRIRDLIYQEAVSFIPIPSSAFYSIAELGG